MRAFYDKIVPNVTNALLKKLGGAHHGNQPRGSWDRGTARSIEQQGASAGFVADVIKVLDSRKGTRSSPAIEGIKDEICQIYLHSMPELSARRHWIHRTQIRH